jgi:hypothetical protein
VKLAIKVAYLLPSGAQVEETITTSISTIAAWERKFKRRVSDMQQGIGIDDIAYLAWHKLTADKKESRDYDAWLATVDAIEVPEVQQPNPTEAAASDAS